jgi:drug/metabolite transporter (DMT)-like permease
MTHARAMLYALGGFFAWVVVDVIIKLSSEGNLSPFAIMSVLGCVGSLSVFISAALKRDFALLRPRSLCEQSVIALCSLTFYCRMTAKIKQLHESKLRAAGITSLSSP